MSRRFLIIALVFAVGFGVGYGATWLIVGSPDKAPAPQPATVAGKAEPTVAPPATSPADAAIAAPTAPGEADAAVAAAPDATPTDDAAVAAAADAAPETPDVAAAEPDTTEAPDTAVAAAEPDAAPAELSWWDACKGKVCVVDWGRVSGGISVREGSIEHGSDVDWATQFAKADKVGTLEAKKGMRLEVLGVGMSEGKPVAAWIKFKNLKGVIALSIGDKAISFRPPRD